MTLLRLLKRTAADPHPHHEGEMMRIYLAILTLVAATGLPHTQARAQEKSSVPPVPSQIVALDECDPTTFNAAIGPDFCKNVALGFSTTFNDLFAKAAAGTPDPGWDFEPDVLHIKKGTPLLVVDQGGEPHTFTEV